MKKAVVDTTVLNDRTLREICSGKDLASRHVCEYLKRFQFTEKGMGMTLKDFAVLAHEVRIGFLQQHRVIYMAWYKVQEFYDFLSDKGHLNKKAEGFWRKVRRAFYDYEKVHRRGMDDATWSTFQDHMNYSYGAIEAETHLLEDAIRDRIIQRKNLLRESGQTDDITLLKKVAVCLVFLTAMQQAYKDYFKKILNDYGVSFMPGYRYAWLDKMVRNYVWMCDAVGVNYEKDAKSNEYILPGVDADESVRVQGIWERISRMVADEDICDEVAMKAINLNPEIKKDYERRIS